MHDGQQALAHRAVTALNSESHEPQSRSMASLVRKVVVSGPGVRRILSRSMGVYLFLIARATVEPALPGRWWRPLGGGGCKPLRGVIELSMPGSFG
jgi:hypothetical protein